ncbi:Tip attachment protein J [uncultured Caudovirales phage]|uniref:Tip attachment protein J n=1 Tax=uncultured Caudovirales phage TaxID=2100421 RepID=A0A6J5KHH2_9CAUD|nr:Tip attachment protein J [uncultured Caudovirales phage]
MPSSLILAAYFGAGAAGLTAATAALGTFGLLAARFAINFAVSMIITRMFGPSDSNAQTNNGVRQQVPPATSNSIPIVYGDAFLGGVFVDAVLSTDQKTMYYVLAISQISDNGQFFISTPPPLIRAGSFVTGTVYTIQFVGTTDYTAIGASQNTVGVSFTATGAGSGTGLAGTNEKMYWQDQLIAFDSTDTTKVISLTDGSGNVNTKINGNIYINLYKSNSSGVITSLNGAAAPNVVMGGSDIATSQQWPSSGRQMYSLAFAIVKVIYNQDAGTTAMEPITFHASHYLNNTGLAKPGDVWYDYITNTKYGCSMDASIVDASTATALNSYSDEFITFTSNTGVASTQPRYQINGVIDTGQSTLSNLDDIMLACDSWNQYNAATGKWSVVINKAETPSYSFDDTNIMGEIRVSAYDISSSINQIQAQFPNKLNRDQSDYVYIETPSGLLFTNEPTNKYSVTYSMTNDSVQAQYLANRMLEQAREDLIVSFATTYVGIQVDAGDVIQVTNAAYGWTNKLFRVIKVSEASLPDGNLGAALELNEYNAQVYDDKDVTQFSPSPNSGLANPNYFTGLTAPTISGSSPTASIPHFNVVCLLPATGRVTQVSLFYTTISSPTVLDWTVWSTELASNSQPFTPSTNVTFTDLTLPQGVYYFAFKVNNETGASTLSPLSSAFTWNPTPVSIVGAFLATFSPPVIQVPRTGGTTPVFTGIITQLYGSSAGGSIDFVTSQSDSDSLFVNNSWRIGASSTTGNADISTTGGLVLGSITDGGTYAQWGVPTVMTSSPATLTVPVRYKSSSGTVTQGATAVLQYTFSDPGATGPAGTTANQYATAYLYQWATSTPSGTTGSSTFTWATGVNSAYSGTGGWSVTIPTNPGTPLIQLWVAAKQISAPGGTATTTVSWTSGVSISAQALNGATGPAGTTGTAGLNGLQTARPTVYQWAITTPASPTGTSAYTWASTSFTPTPTGWSQTITTAPSPGYTLWSAVAPISDSATATTTTINWTSAFILSSGYAGANGTNGTNGSNGTNGTPGSNGIDGLSSRICYAKSTLTSLSSTPAYYVTTGVGAFPPYNEWGGAETWQATPPTISAGEALFQSDGIYNPATTQTTWNVPYLSNLKVGSLSAITTNTGNLSVTGIVQAGSAYVYGTSMGGSGGVLYSGGEFAFGNSSGNISYNGSQLTLNGNVVALGNLQQGTSTTQSGNTFGYGNGTSLYGIATCGFFRTTRTDTAGLAVSGINNVALAVGGASTDSATALFGNTYGNDSINPQYIILGVTIGGTGGGFQQAAFLQRRYTFAGSASGYNPDLYTTGYGRIAYLDGSTNYAAKFMTTAGSTDVLGITVGGPTYGLQVLGAGVSNVGFSPFTGMHLCLLPNTITPVVGDIYYDTSIFLKANVNDVLTFIDASNGPQMQGAIGIFTNMSEGSVPQYMQTTIDKPYMEHGVEQIQIVTITKPEYKTLLEENTLVLVNALGEGLINVCGENGNLAIGDLIVTSSIPGKGMKQNDDIVRSITVARSREAVTFSSTTDVQQVACIYLCG